MDRMRTPLLTSLILLAPAAVFAQANPPAAPPAPAAPTSAPPETTTSAPTAAPVIPAPSPAPAPSSVPSSGTTFVKDAGGASPVIVEQPPAEPASITEVGVQRLPASAYPEWEIRGLKHGSLWLTFHGMQWPYMPSFTNGSRFVVGISGWGWVDNAYETFKPWAADPGTSASRANTDLLAYWKQQARMLLRLTPTYAIDRDYFIQGQVELVGTGDQTARRDEVGGADTDDLYLRIGKWRSWDVTAGRFEGWEVFHLGMGLDQNTFERTGASVNSNQITFYGLTDNQFRPQGAAGNLAFHYYPLPYLRFELLGMAGTTSNPAYAARPVAILDLGWLKFKVGTEYQHLRALQQVIDATESTSKGVGGALQFVFLPHVEFGLNAAQGTVFNIDHAGKVNANGSITRTSLGGFANVSNGHPRHTVLFGVGSMLTWTEDQNGNAPNPVDKYWLYQGYVAAQYVLYNTFYIKLVGGYSRGHWALAGSEPRIEFENEMYSARLRFSFYF
jgi:hypothetical protein